MLISDGLGDTELYVWNVVTAGFDEDWDDMLSDLFLPKDWHDCSEGLDGCHSVVITLLLGVVALNDLGNELFDSPFAAELRCNFFDLLDSHLTD